MNFYREVENWLSLYPDHPPAREWLSTSRGADLSVKSKAQDRIHKYPFTFHLHFIQREKGEFEGQTRLIHLKNNDGGKPIRIHRETYKLYSKAAEQFYHTVSALINNPGIILLQ
jgi:hypothetical protein